MIRDAILRRTVKGDQELQTRSLGLGRGLRTVLILIDGRSTVAQLSAKALGMPGVDAALRNLVAQGFAEEIGGVAPAAGFDAVQAKQELLAIAKALLGDDAGRVLAKFEAAPETRDGLLEAVAQCRKLVRLVICEQKAEQLMARSQAVLDAG